MQRPKQIILSVVLASLPIWGQSDLPATKPRHCSIENGVLPQYPDSLKGSGIQGTVLIQAIVSEEGCTETVKVVQKLNPQLDEIAKQAVDSWKFSPARKDGRPVRVTIQVPVKFKEGGN